MVQSKICAEKEEEVSPEGVLYCYWKEHLFNTFWPCLLGSQKSSLQCDLHFTLLQNSFSSAILKKLGKEIEMWMDLGLSLR